MRLQPLAAVCGFSRWPLYRDQKMSFSANCLAAEGGLSGGHVEEHVEGHDFSRAVRALIRIGFSRCGSALDEPSLSGRQFV